MKNALVGKTFAALILVSVIFSGSVSWGDGQYNAQFMFNVTFNKIYRMQPSGNTLDLYGEGQFVSPTGGMTSIGPIRVQYIMALPQACLEKINMLASLTKIVKVSSTPAASPGMLYIQGVTPAAGGWYVANNSVNGSTFNFPNRPIATSINIGTGTSFFCILETF